jgi:hypothetical protein
MGAMDLGEPRILNNIQFKIGDTVKLRYDGWVENASIRYGSTALILETKHGENDSGEALVLIGTDKYDMVIHPLWLDLVSRCSNDCSKCKLRFRCLTE